MSRRAPPRMMSSTDLERIAAGYGACLGFPIVALRREAE